MSGRQWLCWGFCVVAAYLLLYDGKTDASGVWFAASVIICSMGNRRGRASA